MVIEKITNTNHQYLHVCCGTGLFAVGQICLQATPTTIFFINKPHRGDMLVAAA